MRYQHLSWDTDDLTKKVLGTKKKILVLPRGPPSWFPKQFEYLEILIFDFGQNFEAYNQRYDSVLGYICKTYALMIQIIKKIEVSCSKTIKLQQFLSGPEAFSDIYNFYEYCSSRNFAVVLKFPQGLNFGS